MQNPDIYTHIHCSSVTRNVGAEISVDGFASLVDESPNPEAQQISKELYQALIQYKVIFIRHQKLTEVQLCKFSEYFGSLMQLPYVRPMADYQNVIAVLKEADEINMGVFGGDWHSDFSFLPEPPMASILYSKEIPPVGGDTVWINMAAAFSALDEKQKLFLRGQIAIHTGAPYGVINVPDEDEQFKGSIEMDRNNPEADRETEHPAVCRHPDSDEEMLFISPTYTTRFKGMSKLESKPLLMELYRHCQRPEFSCRFRWSEDTLAIWDNRSTMHYAVNDYDGYRRLMYRTTIKGTRPQA